MWNFFYDKCGMKMNKSKTEFIRQWNEMQCPTNKQRWKMDAASWRSTGDMRTSNIQTMKASLPKPDLVSSPLSLYSGNPILTVLLFHEYPKVLLDLNDIL